MYTFFTFAIPQFHFKETAATLILSNSHHPKNLPLKKVPYEGKGKLTAKYMEHTFINSPQQHSCRGKAWYLI